MFNPMNSVMSGTTVDDLRGVWALLSLISNPQSETALAFLAKLSAEKDEAVEAARAAKAEHDAAETALDEAHEIRQEIEGSLESARIEADRKALELNGREQAVSAREDAVGQREGAHASAVAKHMDAVATDANALAAREKALEQAKQTHATAAADLARRKAEFDRQMAPVIAAAKVASNT
jgi:chromosome segregation protein